jgi:hypothetical protein
MMNSYIFLEQQNPSCNPSCRVGFQKKVLESLMICDNGEFDSQKVMPKLFHCKDDC